MLSPPSYKIKYCFKNASMFAKTIENKISPKNKYALSEFHSCVLNKFKAQKRNYYLNL